MMVMAVLLLFVVVVTVVVTVVVVLLGNKLVDGSLVDQFVLWQVMMMMMLHDALE